MEVQRQSLDRISSLPQDTIEKILSLMPIRDALRTSILSRKWRYRWTTMPKLVFDDNLVDALFDSDDDIDKYKLVNAIFHVLLLHRGPVTEFTFKMGDHGIFNEIDQMILHLSRSNNVTKFVFYLQSGLYNPYKLPFSFFSLHKLEHLDLKACVFEPPLIFNGFSMLRSLRLYHVDIAANTLQRLLTGCPLLEEFTLVQAGNKKCAFVELFKCLPSGQHFAAGFMPLVHLRMLYLDVCFLELPSALIGISTFPVLEKIKVELCWNHNRCVKKTSQNLFDLEDYTGLNLDHLKEFEITRFRNLGPEVEFVKLIMAKSPVLKKTRIELNDKVTIDEEVKMLRDLVRLPFPRASTTAILVIERWVYKFN